MNMFRQSNITRLCAVCAILLGTELIAGWLLQNEAMVRILPSSNSVSFNTAVSFVLAGIAFCTGRERFGALLRRIVAIVLIIGSSVILYENIFDVAFGIDWESLHRKVQDGSPRPGRIAPNTCIGLFLTGMILFFYDRPVTRWRFTAVIVIGALQTMLVASGIVGLLMDPTLMFGWYKFNRMAAPTAFGLSLLTIAGQLGYRALKPAATASARQHERSILVTGALLLLGMGMAGTLTTFVIFANSQQESIRHKLQAELLGQTRLAAIVINQAANETDTLLRRPLLANLLRSVGDGHDPDQTQLLATTFNGLLQTGFTSVGVAWDDRTPGTVVGNAAGPIELSINLKNTVDNRLLWNGRTFFYQAHVPVSDAAGKQIGIVTTERPLDALTDMYHPITDDAESAEVVLCGTYRDTIACYPSKLHPTVLLLKPRTERRALPVDEALTGKSAIRTARDYRGENVVVAYSSIGSTGLALLTKVDTVEIYRPINTLILRSVIVLIVSLAIGMFLMRKTVGPLVKAILESENNAVRLARRMKSITDNVPILIGFVDTDYTYRFANATYESWFGKPLSSILGRHVNELLTEENFAKSWPFMQRAMNGETVSFTVKIQSSQHGELRHLAVTYIPDRNEEGVILGFNVLAFDETTHHNHEEALNHMAHHDSLTELPNRRMVEDRLQQALLRAERHPSLSALFFLDIDYFKTINDTFGHDCGDILLKEFAARLRATVRNCDTVARLGGDEFVIFMENLRATEDVDIVARNILSAIRAPFNINGRALSVTTSIGVSFSSADYQSPQAYLRRSDEALYDAKAAGRDTYVVANAESPN
ncbi:MAG: GGDEF domain-containing protein [Pseudomonadota bacterium]